MNGTFLSDEEVVDFLKKVDDYFVNLFRPPRVKGF